MRSLANTTMQRTPMVQLLTNRQYTTSITDANCDREHCNSVTLGFSLAVESEAE